MKNGDKVKIERKIETINGISLGWVPSMNKYIGQIGTYVKSDSYLYPRAKVQFDDGDGWWFSEACLELVTETAEHKRPHADLIIAWANGAEIQWRGSDNSKWENVENPNFHEEYQYRIKPKEWYENIPPQGVLCWVWDNDDSKTDAVLVIVVNYAPTTRYPFETKYGNDYMFAKPLTEEEVSQFIFKSA